MVSVRFAVLGYGRLLKLEISEDSTLSDVQKALVSTRLAPFAHCGPLDLKLFMVRRFSAGLEATMFLAGKLTPRMRRILRGEKKKAIICESVSVTSQLATYAQSTPLAATILVYAETPSSLQNVKAVTLSEWFPTKSLELNNGSLFLQVGNEPFRINSKKPPSRLFVRRCFVTVLNELAPAIHQAFTDPSTTASRVFVVTGSPGIGKRWFFVYCVFCFLFSDQVLSSLPPFRLVVKVDHHSFVYGREDGGRFVRVEEGSQELQSLRGDPRVLRLVLPDPTRSALYPDAPPIPLTPWRGPTVCVANPRDGRVPCAKLAPRLKRMWILPVWTLNELRIANKALDANQRLSTKALNEHYTCFGGTIERVFDHDLWMRDTDIGHALNAWSLSKLLDLVKSQDGVAQREDQSEGRGREPNRGIQSGLDRCGQGRGRFQLRFKV